MSEEPNELGELDLHFIDDLLGDSSSIDIEEELKAEKSWCYSILVVWYVLIGMCRGARLKYFSF